MCKIRRDYWKTAGIIYLTFLTLFLPVIFSQTDRRVVAQIGDKIITVEDFLQRSELTIRPVYLKDKYTTLNNLIAEKLLALEAGIDSHDFLNRPAIAGKLRGIKEQMMRDSLYYEVAYNQVHLDTGQINRAYRCSLREYEVEFYTLKTSAMAQRVQTVLDSMPELTEQLFRELAEAVNNRPLHRVSYDDPDEEVIHTALFSGLVDTGKVIGPLRLSNGQYIVLKVVDWVDYPLISGVDQRARWNRVKQELERDAARELWHQYQSELMRGKRVEFDPPAFEKLKNIAWTYYLKSTSSDSLEFRLSEIETQPPSIDLNAPFLSIDNRTWTVGDFKRELLAHPLVFRSRNLSDQNFAQQFKLAVVDLVRDYYLTQEAYKRGLDRSAKIENTLALWRDALVAQYQIDRVLEAATQNRTVRADDQIGLAQHREAYIRTLQQKYRSRIKINRQLIEKISLTKLDFFAIRPGVPHPTTLPPFPVLIQSGDLRYTQP